MNTKVKARLLSCAINLFSMGLILFFPGSSTMASVFVLSALCASGIFNDNATEGKKKGEKAIGVVYWLTLIFVLLINFLVLILAFTTTIGSNIENPNIYYIVFKEEVAFLGGSSFSYLYFVITAAIIVFVFEVAGVIKTCVSSKTTVTWGEATQNRVR
ncbi:MAG: hypothetical protein K2L98_01925 [Bacilli bacterium]|nr:hypothetical protein [Bacilli bacterium]